MTVNMRNATEDAVMTQELLCLDLPNEVLVKIISFLPETRDRVKLRYVSQEIRSISETPSLWRYFVWPAGLQSS